MPRKPLTGPLRSEKYLGMVMKKAAVIQCAVDCLRYKSDDARFQYGKNGSTPSSVKYHLTLLVLVP